MTTISIRELRHNWPETESRLQLEKEIIITRDSKPVAKLVHYTESEKPRKRFNPEEHRKWQESIFGKGKVVRLVDKYLTADREDRPLIKRSK